MSKDQDTITTGPAEAETDRVCHEEQLRIWADDLIGALNWGEFLRDDLSYDEGLDLERAVMAEIKRIVGHALAHPERSV